MKTTPHRPKRRIQSFTRRIKELTELFDALTRLVKAGMALGGVVWLVVSLIPQPEPVLLLASWAPMLAA